MPFPQYSIFISEYNLTYTEYSLLDFSQIIKPLLHQRIKKRKHRIRPGYAGGPLEVWRRPALCPADLLWAWRRPALCPAARIRNVSLRRVQSRP